MATPPASARGVVCLGNDAVIDQLTALCASLREHDPGLPLTLIPFDDNLAQTRDLLARHGYELMPEEPLRELDALGRRYWPGENFRPRTMRKLSAFWGPYETFLFLDADIVVLEPLARYFEGFERQRGDFMYFWTDIANVYRPGDVRDAMVRDHGAAGFNTGAFLSRRGALTLQRIEQLAASAQPLRHGFVDNLEQTFINYCVDASDLRQVSAGDAVPELAAAGASMRIRRAGRGYILDDRRVAESGRRVSMIHWAGHSVGPFMPYRRTFLRYALGPQTSLRDRLDHEARALFRWFWHGTPRGAYHRTRLRPFHIRNWLAARGLARWD